MNIPLAAAHTVVETLTAWWRDQRRRTTEILDEAAALNYHDLEGVAADCGISPYQLVHIISAGPQANDEIGEILRALNVEPAAVDAADHENYRKMQIACARCGSKTLCRSLLDSGDAASSYGAFCPNAERIKQAVIGELRAVHERLSN
ncbi:hypothetical protein JJB09_04970 [Rhizobium sp. KVB221]|uniref:Uncharacterized protein n=1 Tax=Rhizobium setariae TaxID=2801340 RepID=A0A936YMC1_9HYPH|nr:hypothetical protein [Rhizobium setariae]MBL0371372.1 hypothetical protein [Rhizobium setariae]